MFCHDNHVQNVFKVFWSHKKYLVQGLAADLFMTEITIVDYFSWYINPLRPAIEQFRQSIS